MKVYFPHIILGILGAIPFIVTWVAAPVILGNLDDRLSDFMLYIYMPIGAFIIPFTVYFCLFTKRITKDEKI